MTTVHAQVASGHEAASVAQKKDGGAPVLLRRGQASEHVLLGPLIAAIRELLEQLLYHGSDNIAGRDGVDTDVVLPPLRGKVTRKLNDSSFASVVGRAYETLCSRVSLRESNNQS